MFTRNMVLVQKKAAGLLCTLVIYLFVSILCIDYRDPYRKQGLCYGKTQN